MLELTQEDKDAVIELVKAVNEVLDAASVDSDNTVLAPMVWQELRSAHISNKQQRVQGEQMEIAKKAGLGQGMNQLGPSAGYYGQKL